MRVGLMVVALAGVLAGRAPINAQDVIANGSRIRMEVCAPGCTEKSGLFLGLDRSTIGIYPIGAFRPERVGLHSITSLAVYRGKVKNRRIGATLGGLAAGIIGGVLFFAGTHECVPVEVLCGVSTRGAYAGMVGSAVVGGLIGGAIGIRVERWDDVRISGMPREQLGTGRWLAGLAWPL